MRIGFILNPIAGIGGSAGLKGSDGHEIQEEALKRGAKPKSNIRAKQFFEILKSENKLPDILSAPGVMGSNLLEELDIPHKVLGEIGPITSSNDTSKISNAMMHEGIDLLIFAGGDGTARDIYDGVKTEQEVLGIPAGTKMHSAVFATKPETAARLFVDIYNGNDVEVLLREVMDIDEEAFRNEVIDVTLYGYMKVPDAPKYVQALKSARSAGESIDIETICQCVVDNMQTDVLYFIGTGSTLASISDILDYEGSLLGVDAVYNKKLIGKDLTEKEILELINKYPNRKIVITVIGGQGYLFGRGNQQLSSDVIERVGVDNIIVIATKKKLRSIKGSLLVDTGNEETNDKLRGYIKILTDYDFYTIKKVD